ncbi:NAD(+)/NADH kinase [Thiospirochaeta perfilievii]|uniref:NAD kinase n=1 Tax=Thiospirochaeta perfilievii TaxID=252967 RepID=A0A5C1QA18_9SPIO|nr:NAD(+)/NADH kinase [Thiospirochaeta perfilievii]QEN03759.1 NAD(+)/NADH kinase [Thiospirochaeta perfilievii]
MATIKNVLLYVNRIKCEATSLESDITTYLNGIGIENSVIYADKQEHSEIKNFDLVITLGGDGTVLQALRRIHAYQIPILGINLGTVGFITEIAKGEWREALDKYIDGTLRVSNRTLLDIKVVRKNREIFNTIGVNDGIVTSNNIKAIIELKVYFSDIEIGEIHGDGVIISTPTGSTAYSLAAGGPIINPEMNALIFTPICPYSLSNRPIVTGGNEIIKVKINKNQRANILLTIDGQESIDLEEEDLVYFREHGRYARVIMSDKRSFFDVVRTKLKWSGGPRA